MNEYGWKAILVDSPDNPFDEYVRLVIAQRTYGCTSYLTESGLLKTVLEGVKMPDDAGIRLPRAALHPIIRAFSEWQGRANDAKTEVAVLRDWLIVERARVDDVLAFARGK
jgi:hypothetical protein